MGSRVGWGFLAFALPIVLLVAWYGIDQSYPHSVSAQYLENTQNTYKVFVEKGWRAATESAYFDRNWRGIIQPVLALPALLITHGNILRASIMTVAVFYAVFLVYFFLNLYALLDKKYRWLGASLGTWMMGCLPWVAQLSHSFNSELPMVMCIAAIFYHALRARELQHQKNEKMHHALLFGVWLGFGFCVRPVEMILIFGCPLLLHWAESIAAGRLSWKDALSVYLQPLLFLVYFLFFQKRGANLRQLTPDLFWISALFGPSLLFMALRKKLGLNRQNFFAMQIAYLVAAAWIIGGASVLLDWFYMGSFGEESRLNGGKDQIDNFNFLWRTYKLVFGWPLFILGLLAAMRGKMDFKRKDLRYWPLMLVPALVMGCASWNAYSRYYVDIGVIGFIGALASALAPGRALKLRFCGVASIAFLCMLVEVIILAGAPVPKKVAEFFPDYFIKNELWDYRQVRVSREDPTPAFVDALSTLVKQKGPLTFYFACTRMQQTPTMNLLAREKGYQWTFENWMWDWPNPPQNTKDAAKLLQGAPNGNAIFLVCNQKEDAGVFFFGLPDLKKIGEVDSSGDGGMRNWRIDNIAVLVRR